jgi:hypothetical protein
MLQSSHRWSVRGVHSRGRLFMPKQKRCPFCRRLFIPDRRLKEQQTTCAREECRTQRRQQSNKNWRLQHPDYFRGMYPQQKEVYGTRAEYKRQYRKQNPEYVRRNAVFVKKYRASRQKAGIDPVSHTSCDLLLSVWNQTGNVSITHVSHTSRDIHVTVCRDKV